MRWFIEFQKDIGDLLLKFNLIKKYSWESTRPYFVYYYI